MPPTVDAAAALTSTVGDGSGIDCVWCSPKPKKSRPTPPRAPHRHVAYRLRSGAMAPVDSTGGVAEQVDTEIEIHAT